MTFMGHELQTLKKRRTPEQLQKRSEKRQRRRGPRVRRAPIHIPASAMALSRRF